MQHRQFGEKNITNLIQLYLNYPESVFVWYYKEEFSALVAFTDIKKEIDNKPFEYREA